MSKIKIYTVLGARPQFIKAAAFSRVLKNYYADDLEESIVHTGQHFDADMSDVFFRELNIPKPNYNLNISNLSHGAMTGRMIEELEKIFMASKPSMVLVYGDTNSTLAATIAASKLRIKIIHIEAGLRSFNLKMPEEINRVTTDHIADILFAPTSIAMQNLAAENLQGKSFLVGDIMYDAFLYYQEKSISYDLNMKLPEKYVLATLHRQENTDNPERLSAIVDFLNEVHNKYYPVVMPLHPRTEKMLAKLNLRLEINTIKPVSYLAILKMLSSCQFVVTDSGGLQKEAFFAGKFCFTLREETEWQELVDNKVNKIVDLKSNIKEIFTKNHYLQDSVFEKNLYGQGNTAKLICDYILSKYAVLVN